MLTGASWEFSATPDQWLTPLLDKACYRVDAMNTGRTAVGPTDYGVVRKALVAALPKGPSFAYTKAGSDESARVALLEDAGFHVVEAFIQYAKAIAPGGVGSTDAPDSIGCRMVSADLMHREAVTSLAGKGFVHSRFHRDPNISVARAHMVKAAWAANYFEGRRGEGMDVALVDGAVAGFLLLLRRGGDLVVDLIAVDGKFRRRGIAKALIGHAWLSRPGVERVVAGTQVSNLAAMAMYQNLGFVPVASGFSLHRHGE